MDKRYQILVSSTFVDLKEERANVISTILSMDHIPAGMELFPASPETPWEIIQRTINFSDYYLVVVGGKYGSTDAEGISYTEKEYDYAHQQHKPIIAFLHEDPQELRAKLVEVDPAKSYRRS